MAKQVEMIKKGPPKGKPWIGLMVFVRPSVFIF